VAESSPQLPGPEYLLEHVPCGVVVTDSRGTILHVNRTFSDWSGFAPMELVGRKKLQDLFTVGGRIFHQTHWMPMLQIQGSLAEVKFEVRRSDGRLLTMMLNAVRHAAPDASYDLVTLTVAEDRNRYERELLRERQRSEELFQREVQAQRVLRIAEHRLRQALRVGDMHLWDVDRGGQRRYEQSVNELLGRVGGAEVPEAEFCDAIVADDRPLEKRAFERALVEPDRVHSWSFRVRGADGVLRVLVASGQAFRDDRGALFQFVGVLRDVTEAARLRAQAEDRALFAEQMVGIVSHDLRNPLSAIMMGTSLLAQAGGVTPQQSRILERVVRSSERARRLIDELLDFTLARVGHGLSVSRQPVDLHELVARSVVELQLAFPGRAIVHRAEGPGSCTADADRIAQLLGNLIANAVTYGAPDTEITVTSTVSASECRLIVHNHGEPITPELQASIFQPMVRGGSEDQSLRSVGLGLFIVKAIAQAHHGDVSVSSSAGAGTSFTFMFPTGLEAG
jgi:sigma-B regulation protein RsbU (phosphoserine phosphatase)